VPDPVIELDRHEEMEELLSSRRPALIWPGRGWLGAILAVACLLALGSAGPAFPAIELVADLKVRMESELIGLSGELLIEEPGKLTALDSRTARPRWQLSTGLDRHLIRAEGGLVFASGETPAGNGVASQTWSLAVEMQTGKMLWRLPGMAAIVGDHAVTHVVDRSASIPQARLAVYDLAGHQVWSKGSVGLLYTVDLGRRSVLTLDRLLGELVEYNIGNGNEIDRSIRPELAGANGLSYLDGEVVAFFSDGRVVSRSDSEFLTWHGFPEGQQERADCGSLWCVYSPATSDIMLVDKASDQLVHRGDRWQLAVHTEAGVVGIGPNYSQAISELLLFDPVTGREQKLPGWWLIGPRVDARVVSWRGPLFLMSAAPLHTFIAVVGGGGMRVAGSVPYEHLNHCAATSYLIACRVDPQTVKVWHPR
jgi:hypothetical protein